MSGMVLAPALLAVAAVLLAVAVRLCRTDSSPDATAERISAPPPPAAASRTPAAPVLPAAPLARRVGDTDIVSLARYMGTIRRRLNMGLTVQQALAALDPADWHVERHLMLHKFVTVPFTVLGPTRVFLIAPGDGWSAADLDVLRDCERSLSEALLPGYGAPIHGAVVVSDIEGDRWFGSDEAGGWIVDVRHLDAWLHSFSDPGFARDDVAELRHAIAHGAPAAQRRDA